MLMSYVLKFPNGKYYTGRAGEGYLGPRSEAFVFRDVNGAARKKMVFDAYHGKTACRIVSTLLSGPK
jgi:hypothetical protein